MKLTANNIKSQIPCISGWKNTLLFLAKHKLSRDDELDQKLFMRWVGYDDFYWCIDCLKFKIDDEIYPELVMGVSYGIRVCSSIMQLRLTPRSQITKEVCLSVLKENKY